MLVKRSGKKTKKTRTKMCSTDTWHQGGDGHQSSCEECASIGVYTHPKSPSQPRQSRPHHLAGASPDCSSISPSQLTFPVPPSPTSTSLKAATSWDIVVCCLVVKKRAGLFFQKALPKVMPTNRRRRGEEKSRGNLPAQGFVFWCKRKILEKSKCRHEAVNTLYRTPESWLRGPRSTYLTGKKTKSAY